MLDFLFKKKTEFNRAQSVNEMYSALKDLYKPESISEERRNYLSDLINKYGYIPYSYSKACSELSDADVIYAVEQKWLQNGVLNNGKLSFIGTPNELKVKHNETLLEKAFLKEIQ